MNVPPLAQDARILVTGAAGFIGFHVAKRLLSEGATVIGLDNLNDYYDPKIKEDRLKELRDQIFHRKSARVLGQQRGWHFKYSRRLSQLSGSPLGLCFDFFGLRIKHENAVFGRR